jgi:MFS family permease
MEPLTRILHRNRSREAKPGSGFLQLFISKRLIHGAATALLSVFVPIFLFEMWGRVFWPVGLYYALLSLLYVLLLVPGMYITNQIGFSRTLVLGGIFSVFTYVLMYFLQPENIALILPFLTIAIVGFRIFHWVPFHVDFTLFTNAGERGRMVSLSMATIAFMGVIGPILAGYIVQNSGYPALFLIAMSLLIVATISYGFVPETSTRFEWSWLETWHALASQRLRGVVVGEFANGAEVATNIIVWPIFLFVILEGDVFEIGAVSTIIVGITVVMQLLLGRYLDKAKENHARTLRVGSVLSAIGWILKIFVLSALQVFFVGLYHNIVRIFARTPFSAIIYDMSAEQGSYVDEFTVVREMAGHMGRAAGLLVVATLTTVIPIGWTFLLAATASIALNMVYRAQQSM